MGQNKRIVEHQPDPHFEEMIRLGMDVETYLRYISNKTVLILMLHRSRNRSSIVDTA